MTAAPKHVVRFENDMVAAFDADGEQIPELQGRFQDVVERIRLAANADTIFEGVSVEAWAR